MGGSTFLKIEYLNCNIKMIVYIYMYIYRRYITPHMYVRNQVVVPLFAWYFRISIGCGTGNKPTRVPCWRNLRISDSSVRPLQMDTFIYKFLYFESIIKSTICTYLSIHIFSTWGTSTCNNRMIVCSGSLLFHECTHSAVGTHWPWVLSVWALTRRLAR